MERARRALECTEKEWFLVPRIALTDMQPIHKNKEPDRRGVQYEKIDLPVPDIFYVYCIFA